MASSSKILILDTDVIANFLLKEKESVTGKDLWQAPAQLFEMIEKEMLTGRVSMMSLIELRYLLRRKKKISEPDIEELMDKIYNTCDVVTQTELSISGANELQKLHLLDPFDSLLLSFVVSMEKGSALISRDKELLKTASKYVAACTPEEYLKNKRH